MLLMQLLPATVTVFSLLYNLHVDQTLLGIVRKQACGPIARPDYLSHMILDIPHTLANRSDIVCGRSMMDFASS